MQGAGPSTGVGGGREVRGATFSVSCLGVVPRMADRAFKGRSAGDVSPGAACLATRRRVVCRGCACHASKTRVRRVYAFARTCMREACRAPSRAEGWVGVATGEATTAEGYASRAEPRESGRSESSPSKRRLWGCIVSRAEVREG